MIKLSDFPQLQRLAWNRAPDDGLDPGEALALYEANWRFVSVEDMTTAEKELLDWLIAEYGNGVLHV